MQTFDDFFGFAHPEAPKRTEELLDHRCLILCGEPGMGKTSTLKLEGSVIRQRIEGAGGGLLWRSFREVFNPQDLLNELKTRPEWRGWCEGGRELSIVIDGVDEGLALSLNVVSGLVTELTGKPVDRLRLVLVCRDVDWPEAEGKRLLSLWPEEKGGRFQLLRLRASDAEVAAKHWGLSPDNTAAFMREVDSKAVEAFAARPITLRMLVREFQNDSEMPGTRLEIFRRGSRRLCCEDPNRKKLLRRTRDFDLSQEELYKTSSRIAARLLLGAFGAVTTVPEEELPPQHVRTEHLVPRDAGERERATVRAVLESALFASAGREDRTFALQSIAEFLTAEYLAGLPLRQILDLVCVVEGGQLSLAPQLAEVAAWLGLQHEEFRGWLLENQPDIFLRNDASCLPEPVREELVQGILDRMAKEEVFDDWDLKRFYGSLRHRRLANQLQPFLRDKDASRIVRRAAIHLADLGSVHELFDGLLAIARDKTEDQHLREQAMNAVARMAPDDRLIDLEPFALCDMGSDPRDELRGAALDALVPKRWKVSEALPALGKPSNTGFIGRFEVMCDRLADRLDPQDLAAVINYLATVDQPFLGSHNPFKHVAERSLVLALGNLDDPTVADALIRFVRLNLRKDTLPARADLTAWRAEMGESPSARHNLLQSFVSAEGIDVKELRLLFSHEILWLSDEDCGWAVDKLMNGEQDERCLWASAIDYAFWRPAYLEDSDLREMLYSACEDCPELAAEVGWPCVVVLHSDAAKQWRQSHDWSSRQSAWRDSNPEKASADDRFSAALEAARRDWHRWPALTLELQHLEPPIHSVGLSVDPTKTSRWRKCSSEEQGQVVACAKDYLLGATPIAAGEEEAEQESPPHVFWAVWLCRDLLQSDERLRAVFCERWLSAVFCGAFRDTKEGQELIQLAASTCPGREEAALEVELAKAGNGSQESPFRRLPSVLQTFKPVWTPTLSAILTRFVASNDVLGEPLFQAVRFLATVDRAEAQACVDAMVREWAPHDPSTILAVALLLYPERHGTSASEKLAANPAVGRTCLGLIAAVLDGRHAQLMENHPVGLAASMFRLIEQAWPTEKDGRWRDDRSAARERIEILRNALLKHIEAAGTDEACQMLVKLANEFPHWGTILRRHLEKTRRAKLQACWSGVPIEVLRGIEAKSSSRWVRGADDLMEVVTDSLHRFYDELQHRDYPTIHRLWNDPPANGPKSEEILTQEIAHWLKQDLGTKNGVVLGCQVQPTTVHETDIEVSAVTGDSQRPTPSFVVTIEVKRHFNPEVAKSLEMQLIKEYLLGLSRTHGLYLVAWYAHQDWKKRRGNPLGAKSFEQARSALQKLLQRSQAAHPELKLKAICLNCEFPIAFRKRN